MTLTRYALVLTAVLASGGKTANAQTELHGGALAGLRATTIGGDIEYGTAGRGAAGGFVAVDFSPYLAGSVELAFAYRGAAANDERKDYRLGYLSAPLLAHGRVPIASTTRARATLGLDPSFLLFASVGPLGEDGHRTGVRDQLNVVDVGLVAAVAIERRISCRWVFAEARYVRGVRTLDPDGVVHVTNRELGLWLGGYLW